MIRHLTDGYFDPEYVLLFGKLAGGTPHSDAVAYDLLIVVRETPEYDWIRAKRILRLFEQVVAERAERVEMEFGVGIGFGKVNRVLRAAKPIVVAAMQ